MQVETRLTLSVTDRDTEFERPHHNGEIRSETRARPGRGRQEADAMFYTDLSRDWPGDEQILGWRMSKGAGYAPPARHIETGRRGKAFRRPRFNRQSVHASHGLYQERLCAAKEAPSR
jgi:hypothetical protein